MTSSKTVSPAAEESAIAAAFQQVHDFLSVQGCTKTLKALQKEAPASAGIAGRAAATTSDLLEQQRAQAASASRCGTHLALLCSGCNLLQG